MLLLLFHIGEDLYAIDTANVIEIVPMMLLRKVQPAPGYLAGVFNYHGDIVPVIDLCRLLTNQSCRACYSTRIIIVNYDIGNAGQINNPEQVTHGKPLKRPLGLMAERVTETLKVSNHEFQVESSAAENLSNSPYLGELFIEEKGMIQKVNWEHLITDAQQTLLWIQGNGQANGAGYY